jgi:hypothetical protein
MSKKPETRIQLTMQKALRKEFKGCYVRKIHGNEFTPAGMPDLICCIDGLFISIEVKTLETMEKEDKLQDDEAKDIRKAGGVYFKACKTSQVIYDVREYLRLHRVVNR